jgi:hypothetical protein
MINVRFEDKVYEVKSTMSEILINDFETIISIMNNKKNYIDRWSEVFIILGLPEAVLENMDSSDFINVIKEIDINTDVEVKLEKEITIDNVVYKTKHDEVKISVKEMRLIEKFIIDNDSKYIGDIMAVLYRNESSDDTINFDLSHIKYKAKLFRDNVTVDKSLPFLKYLSTKIVKDFNTIKNEYSNT